MGYWFLENTTPAQKAISATSSLPSTTGIRKISRMGSQQLHYRLGHPDKR